jgi:uncharacterized membrane protein YphA (DoxX/SURF4 family)
MIVQAGEVIEWPMSSSLSGHANHTYHFGSGIERTAQLLEKFGYPAPLFLTYVIASLETFGGVLLVVGLFVRPVMFALVIFMLFVVHYTSMNSGWKPA